MVDNNESKAKRGSISQIILTILGGGSRYGYDICKEIEKISDGELIMKQPSLYSNLRRMEEQNLISSSWQDSKIGGKRHYYSLTAEGQKKLEQNSWQLTDLINHLPTTTDMDEIDMEDNSKQNNFNENFSVAKQENLFNVTHKEDIKRIDDYNKENDKQSFFQFDFFNQNIKSVKNDSPKNLQKVEKFSNRYENLDNHQEDIEPIKLLDEDENKNMADMIKRDDNLFNKENEDTTSLSAQDNLNTDIFSNSNFENKNEESENKDSNFDIKKLVENEPEEKEESLFLDNKPIVREQKDISWQEEIEDHENIFESNDYRAVIGKLYSNSQMADPYEQNKFNTFKEIFPQTQVRKEENKKTTSSEIDNFVESNTSSNISCDDIKMLSNLYSLQGIKIKRHNNIENKKNDKIYTDKNKLNMVSNWIMATLMIVELALTYMLLKNGGNIVPGQKLLYFLGLATSLSFLIVPTLENIFDRFKLVIIKYSFKKDFTKRLLIFIFIVVFVFVVCLAFGMNGLLQVEFLSYWLVPIIMASNILVSYVIYYFLLKSKSFNS